MDESGRKILIWILIAIVAGVSAYFLVFGTSVSPVEQMANDENSESGRPAGDGVVSPEANVVTQAMIGTWQSAEDTEFTREFKEDGTFVDRDGEVAEEGIWGVFTVDMAAAGTTTTGLVPGVVYLQITIDGTSSYFIVARAADTLELRYLDREGQENFTRAE